jgi:hypothetical protein
MHASSTKRCNKFGINKTVNYIKLYNFCNWMTECNFSFIHLQRESSGMHETSKRNGGRSASELEVHRNEEKVRKLYRLKDETNDALFFLRI